MKAIRTHGGLKRHHHPILGTNGRFDTIQAAILLAKLPHLVGKSRTRPYRSAILRRPGVFGTVSGT